MTKKIILGFVAFFVGIVVAYFSESFLRGIIQDVFKWSTADKIQFFGKNFYAFSNKLYFLTFGIVFLILTIENLNKKITQLLNSGIISVLIFGAVLVGIAATDANFKIVECTACDDGIRKLHWNEINYGLIIGLSQSFQLFRVLLE
ncbi:MAG: hypothetical protein P8N19_12155 [Flavobacteriales bacterium]|nr:hypothetical protein [Flavobacteriales bacterium]